MPFAITALFDARTEVAISDLRQRLANAGFGDRKSAKVRPHLTLAIMDALDAEALREPLRAWGLSMPPPAIGLTAVGTFPGPEGVVFLSPIVTAPLLEMHARLDALLARGGWQGHLLYRPGHWVPHVTVGIGLSGSAVGGAVILAREAGEINTGVLTQVAVAEFPPLRALYCFPLGAEAERN